MSDLHPFQLGYDPISDASDSFAWRPQIRVAHDTLEGRITVRLRLQMGYLVTGVITSGPSLLYECRLADSVVPQCSPDHSYDRASITNRLVVNTQ